MKKKVMWSMISICLAVFSVWMVAKQSSTFQLDVLLANIKDMNKGWLALAFASMFGFIFFEGMAVVRIARSLGFKAKKRRGVVYGAADVYFSAITPSASGGQPASAYFMIRDGISGSMSAVILLLNLIMYCVALITVGIIAFLGAGKLMGLVSIKFKILFVFGAVVMVGLAVLFYLALKKEQFLIKSFEKFLQIFAKIGLVKNIEKRREKMKHSMMQYKECSDILSGDHKLIRDAFLLNLLQRLSHLGVTFFVFMACGRGLQMSLNATVMQTFVAIGSNTIPVPGAMGVADYMMLDGFGKLIGNSDAVSMELLCRGITFYGSVITGGLITLAGYCTRKREK